jgi:uncharacterized protein
MKTALRLLALTSLALSFFVGRAMADDVSDAKQRIAARQAEVAALKTSGAVGENNRGFLEVRGGGGSSASVVAEESRDRGILYAEVAKRTGVSAEEAGRARAKQIAANSAPGIWLQREDGAWYKK